MGSVPATSLAPAVDNGLALSVKWQSPGSKKWHQYEDRVARAVMFACTSGKATTGQGVSVRRSPRLHPVERKPLKKGRHARRPTKVVKAASLTSAGRSKDLVTSAMYGRAVRWSVSRARTFNEMPQTPRQLAAMVFESETLEKRRVLSSLLNFLTWDERIKRFLADVSKSSAFLSSSAPYGFSGDWSISKGVTNPNARPLGALYERFLGAMAGHEADLGGALLAFMAGAPLIAPFLYAFHGTPSINIPSIRKNGMLPEKTLCGRDWFSTSPWRCTTYSVKTHPVKSIKLILFLLLPVQSALASYRKVDLHKSVTVMKDESYELPLCTVILKR